MASEKKYWRSIEELDSNNLIIEQIQQNEFVDKLPTLYSGEHEFLGNKEKLEESSTTRRDFLKYVGFTTAAAALAACEGPVHKAIPYVVMPEQIRPGIPDYYATTMADGFDFASILVKTREGRPIKIDNNRQAPYRGSGNARVQASVLSMYDSMRVKNPKRGNEDITWDTLDASVLKALETAQQAGKQIVLLTNTLASPSTYALIKEFSEKYTNAKHIQYDAISEEAGVKAFEKKYGVRALADYDFSKADVIVSFGADFIAEWQGGYEDEYAIKRIPKNGKMSKHIQFETIMSLSGANADRRVALKPSELKVALAKFYGYLNGQNVAGNLPEKAEIALKKAAEQVKKAGSRAVVLTGIQDEDAQGLVLEINSAIQSEAFCPQNLLYIRQGNAKEVSQLITDMNAGKVGVLIMANVNPLYSLADSFAFETGLSKVDCSVAFSLRQDETSTKTTYTAATPHYLESWGDVEMKKGFYTLMQPTIRPLFDTRQIQDALTKWLNKGDYYQYLKSFWNNNILGETDSWEKSLHDGFFVSAKTIEPCDEKVTLPISEMVSNLAKSTSEGFEIQLYAKTGLGDGQQANNPWLQELPDPISRVSWDNYLTISASDAKELGLKNWHVADGALDGDYAEITVNDVKLKVPVLIQPGQAKGSFGLAFGYGRLTGMQKEMQVGVNAYAIYFNSNNVQKVSIAKSSGTHEYACVQLHNTLMGRGDILKETTLEDLVTKSPEEWNKKPVVSLDHKETKASTVTLWKEFDQSTGHLFNLAIDLNACTGCGACVIACHAENNVPVVGKEEIRRSRDMHWLRIDRYYSSEETFAADEEKVNNISGLGAALTTFGEMEDPSENPQVAFQPVMCQHCNNAPCETVCPVGATSHGLQGQNHMAYNRCVGTRYCANNCPYKVRRFNWFLYSNNNEFDYHMNNDYGKMVLNPDVVVRSRGVMEKCSFCIQETQAVILRAKRENREVKVGEFNDACACSAACGTGAMTFGDVNNAEDPIVALKEDDRMYHLLEHIGTKPNVFYQVKVRNTSDI